jgi:membrane protease YdiL (CAAX protease family)
MLPNEPLAGGMDLHGERPLTAPWGWRDLAFGIAAGGAGLIVLNLILLALGAAAGGTVVKNGIVLTIFVAVQDSMIVGAAALFSIVRYRVGWDRLGFRGFNVALGCGLSIALLIFSYGVRICYGIVATGLGYRPALQDVLSRLDTQGFGFVLTLIAAAVIAPIAEETFFRGFVYGGLRGRIGSLGAMLVSTLFFTALHFTLDQFIPIFALGLTLAWLYERTGSLYPGMLLHASNNAISLVLLAFARATGILPGQF